MALLCFEQLLFSFVLFPMQGWFCKMMLFFSLSVYFPLSAGACFISFDKLDIAYECTFSKVFLKSYLWLFAHILRLFCGNIFFWWSLVIFHIVLFLFFLLLVVSSSGSCAASLVIIPPVWMGWALRGQLFSGGLGCACARTGLCNNRSFLNLWGG